MPPGKTELHPGVGVAILAKAPLAGFAKTRLIPRLGAEGAAGLQRWLLQRTVTTALSAGIGPVTMWWLRLRFHFGASPDDLAREYGYAVRKN